MTGTENGFGAHGQAQVAVEASSVWVGDADFFTDDRDADETLEDQDRQTRTFTRQVSVKLTAGQHAELRRAADLYGVAPGTMARILVRRGSRAVLDYQRRYDREQGLPD
jgi:hypothetical protein